MELTLFDHLKSLETLGSQKMDLARHEYLLTPGVVENYIYFVEEGALRLFYMSEYEEHDIRFAYSGNLITSLSSFLTDNSSEYFIQAIRKSTIFRIPKKEFFEFVNSDIKWLKDYVGIMENVVLQQLEREIDILTESPQDRLKRVLHRSPKLFQEIPLKYIASYLRMTPETLSRLRSKL